MFWAEKWLSGVACLQVSQRTWIHFPAHTSGDSQLLVTPAPGHLVASVGTCTHVACTHNLMNVFLKMVFIPIDCYLHRSEKFLFAGGRSSCRDVKCLSILGTSILPLPRRRKAGGRWERKSTRIKWGRASSLELLFLYSCFHRCNNSRRPGQD